jgi:hypothetical protein
MSWYSHSLSNYWWKSVYARWLSLKMIQLFRTIMSPLQNKNRFSSTLRFVLFFLIETINREFWFACIDVQMIEYLCWWMNWVWISGCIFCLCYFLLGFDCQFYWFKWLTKPRKLASMSVKNDNVAQYWLLFIEYFDSWFDNVSWFQD